MITLGQLRDDVETVVSTLVCVLVTTVASRDARLLPRGSPEDLLAPPGSLALSPKLAEALGDGV